MSVICFMGPQSVTNLQKLQIIARLAIPVPGSMSATCSYYCDPRGSPLNTDISGMIHQPSSKPEQQQTTDLLICHGTQQE